MLVALKELEAVERLTREAQARVSLMAAVAVEAEARDAFAAGRFDSGSVNRVADAIQGGRVLSARLAASGYNLARAASTGQGYGIPSTLDKAPSKLDVLRDSHISLVTQLADMDTTGLSAVERGLIQVAKDMPEDTARAQLLSTVYHLSDSLAAFDKVRGGDERLKKPEDFDWYDGSLSVRAESNVAQSLVQHQIKPALAKVQTVLEMHGGNRDNPTVAKTVNDSASKLAGKADAYIQRAARVTTYKAVRGDRSVMQMARGTADNPCAFCAMLASRGYIYKADAFGVFEVHPNCHCYPVYRWEKSPVGGVEYWVKMWGRLRPADLADWRIKLAAYRAGI